MAKLYWLGAALILIAVSYQYRKEIQTLVLNLSKSEVQSDTKSAGKENVDSKRQEEALGKKLEQPPPKKSAKSSEESKKEKDTTASEKYYNPPFDPKNPPEPLYSKTGTRLITLNELAAHGHSGPLKPIWLAVMGRVYDVDKGAEHYYGPDGGYKFFTGKLELLSARIANGFQLCFI